MINLSSFEEFQGEKPYRLLDQHPDGIHVAMQIQTSDAFLAAIWNNETKQLAWTPEDTYSLAWLRQGTQLAALQNPLSSENFFFSIYSWPQSRLLQQCPLQFPMGYFFDLVISPNNDFAICQWIDQSEAGFEFVDITAQRVSYDAHASYFLAGINDVTRAVFSPGGEIWVFGYKLYEIWWVSDPEDIATYDQPARGGEYPRGALQVFRQKHPLAPTIPLIATLPAEWMTTDPDADSILLLGDPVFLDEHQVQLRLPSGEIQVYLVAIE